MFDSVKYNLTNPAFTDDIGEANMHRMLPGAPSWLGGGFIPGVTGTMNGVTMMGSLAGDRVEIKTQREKDKKIWATVFKGAALVVGGALCWKYGKKLGSKIWNGMKILGSKIKTMFKK